MIVTPADGKSLDKVLKLIGKTPEDVTLELDWSQAQGGERRRDERGRGSRNERPPRGRSRRGEDEVRVRVNPEAEPAEAAADAANAPPPRRGRRRPEAEPVVEAAAPSPRRPERDAETPAPRPLSRRGVQAPVPRDDDDRRIVGFGNDIPAFLMRAPPKIAKTEAE